MMPCKAVLELSPTQGSVEIAAGWDNRIAGVEVALDRDSLFLAPASISLLLLGGLRLSVRVFCVMQCDSERK